MPHHLLHGCILLSAKPAQGSAGPGGDGGIVPVTQSSAAPTPLEFSSVTVPLHLGFPQPPCLWRGAQSQAGTGWARG